MDHDATRHGLKPCTQDEEVAFAHLEELLAALPGMQEQGARLARARHAEAVARAAETRDASRSMWDLAEEQLAAAEKALAEARACGDEAAVDACRRTALYAASLRGFRVGPVRNAERAVDEALAASPFSDVHDALAARLGADELRDLEAGIEAFQKDYAETLAMCERCEDTSGEGR